MTPRHVPSRSRTTRPFAGVRSAITLLEVILAVFILSLVVATVTGAISAIAGMEAESRKRVEAYEIANRLMLQYLDDKSALPSDALPIAYGEHRYFWSLDKTPTRMVINKTQEARIGQLQATDRFSLVAFTVFDSQRSGDLETRAEPIAFISRVVDPAAPRSPDTIERYNDPNALGVLIGEVLNANPQPYKETAMRGRQLR